MLSILSRISRTQVGGIVLGILAVLKPLGEIFGFTVPITDEEATNAIAMVAELVAGLVGFWLVVTGRMRADRPAGLLFKKD